MFDPTASPAENLKNIFGEQDTLTSRQAQALAARIKDPFKDIPDILFFEIRKDIRYLTQKGVLTEAEGKTVTDAADNLLQAAKDYEAQVRELLDEATRRYGIERTPKPLKPYLAAPRGSRRV